MASFLNRHAVCVACAALGACAAAWLSGSALDGRATSPRAAAARDGDPSAALRATFGSHAADVLDLEVVVEETPHGLVLTPDVVDRSSNEERLDAEETPERAVARLRAQGGSDGAPWREPGFRIALPHDGESPIEMQLPNGPVLRVIEEGTTGPSRTLAHSVTYAHRHGRVFWTSSDGGYEEWLALEAGVAFRDRAVAHWRVQGGVLSVVDGTVRVSDEHGMARMTVSAPRAWDASGRAVGARLDVEGDRIALYVDAAGAEVLVDPQWAPAASLGTGRVYATSTLLQSGKVLVVGGKSSASVEPDWCEQYDPATNTWSGAGTLTGGRTGHTATLLLDGKVLVFGGYGGGQFLGEATVYDPTTNTWTAAASSTARNNHTATRLPDGRVLVAGGSMSGGDTATVVIYNPVTNAWSNGATMPMARSGHHATLLSTGKVFVSGGRISLNASASCQLYDPVTNTWTLTPSMTSARERHRSVALSDGSVLVIGGLGASGDIATVERYDPIANVWTARASLAQARRDFTAARLSDGRVIVVGGGNGLASAERFDPTTNVWWSAGSLATGRSLHVGEVLANGRVLVAGGISSSSVYLSSSELLSPSCSVNNGGCDATTTCDDSTGVISCGNCPAGSSSGDGTGGSACVPCAAGTVSTTAGSTSCTACAAGTFAAQAGSTSCTTATVCSASTYEVAPPTASSDRVCVGCSVCATGYSQVSACTANADTVCVADTPDAGMTHTGSSSGGCAVATHQDASTSGLVLIALVAFGRSIRRSRRA